MWIKEKEENRESILCGKKREDGIRYEDERYEGREEYNNGRFQESSNYKSEESKNSTFNNPIEDSKNNGQIANFQKFDHLNASPANKKLPSYMYGQPYIPPPNSYPNTPYNSYYPAPYSINNVSPYQKQEHSESKLKDEYEFSNPNENSFSKKKIEPSLPGYAQGQQKAMYDRISDMSQDLRNVDSNIQNSYTGFMKPFDDPSRRNSYGSDKQSRDYKDKELISPNQNFSQYDPGKSTMPKSSFRNMNYQNDYKYYDQMYANGYYWDPRMYNYNGPYSIDPTMQGNNMNMAGYPYSMNDRETGYMSSYSMNQDPYTAPYSTHQGGNPMHSMPDYRYPVMGGYYNYYSPQNLIPDSGYQYNGMNSGGYGYQSPAGMNYELQNDQSRIQEDIQINRGVIRQQNQPGSERGPPTVHGHSGNSDQINDQSVHKNQL